MSDTTQAVIQTGLPTLAVLIGILVNNSRLTDLRAHMDTRFEDLKAMWRAELRATAVELKADIAKLDLRVARLEERPSAIVQR